MYKTCERGSHAWVFAGLHALENVRTVTGDAGSEVVGVRASTYQGVVSTLILRTLSITTRLWLRDGRRRSCLYCLPLGNHGLKRERSFIGFEQVFKSDKSGAQK